MSLRNLTPLTKSHLSHAQVGRDVAIIDENNTTGHAGGHSGAGSQDYVEYLAGVACGQNTSSDNTTGTKYFPDIPYWCELYNLSVDIVGIGAPTLVELEVTASSIVGDDLVKPTAGGDVVYNPDDATSHYMHIFHGDIVTGKFNRVSIFKTSASDIKGRLLLTRGVGDGT